eukprot:NODE_32_length_37098_cov_1.132760.p22 type:complete len:177 gc:universal NODE_32_length_37098_cov_1.132760:6360-6890(+)
MIFSQFLFGIPSPVHIKKRSVGDVLKNPKLWAGIGVTTLATAGGYLLYNKHKTAALQGGAIGPDGQPIANSGFPPGNPAPVGPDPSLSQGAPSGLNPAAVAVPPNDLQSSQTPLLQPQLPQQQPQQQSQQQSQQQPLQPQVPSTVNPATSQGKQQGPQTVTVGGTSFSPMPPPPIQ